LAKRVARDSIFAAHKTIEIITKSGRDGAVTASDADNPSCNSTARLIGFSLAVCAAGAPSTICIRLRRDGCPAVTQRSPPIRYFARGAGIGSGAFDAPAVIGRRIWEDAMSSKKFAIDALVDALAELPEHELEGGGSAATGWGCASYASLVGAIRASCRRRGRFAASRPERPPPLRPACERPLVWRKPRDPPQRSTDCTGRCLGHTSRDGQLCFVISHRRSLDVMSA
jgi:hypothetical protein